MLELLDVLLFALAEGSLRGSILCASPLERERLVCICVQAAGYRWGAAYDAHVGYGLFVLRGRRPPSSPILVQRGCEVHKFNRVGDGSLVEI